MFGPKISHPCPAFGFVKQRGDLCKGELPEHPQRKHFFIGLLQRVQKLMEPKSVLLAKQPVEKLLRRQVIRERNFFLFSMQGKKCVFGDLAKPYADFAISSKSVKLLQSFKKGFLRYLLRKVPVPAQ